MSQSKTLTRDVDVVIVGSGPIGSTFARIIHDVLPEAKILLVEGGPRLNAKLGEHVQNLSSSERTHAEQLAQGPSNGRAHVKRPFYEVAKAIDDIHADVLERPGLFSVGEGARVAGEFGMPAASMSSGVGGMGVHWTASVPLPTGAERISFIPEEELQAAYADADSLLGVSRDIDVDDEILTSLIATLREEFDVEAEGEGEVQLTPFAITNDINGTRIAGTNVILGDLLERNTETFELRPSTIARRLIWQDGKVTGVELFDRESSVAYVVQTRSAVVAADALRTPQLLHASGIRPNALGHYLNDHLKVIGVVRLASQFKASIEPIINRPRPVGSVLIPYVEGIRPVQGQVHLGSRSPMSVAAGGKPTDRFAMSGDESQLPDGALAWYGAKEICYEDAVTFSDSSQDSFGLPAMTIRYKLTEKDHRTVELLRRDATRAGNLVGEIVGGEPALMPGGSSLHYQGTTRMGETNDGTSVCDTYSRVWGFENLYIGGNNVIPTATACNPTITSVALAARAARQLCQELRSA